MSEFGKIAPPKRKMFLRGPEKPNKLYYHLCNHQKYIQNVASKKDGLVINDAFIRDLIKFGSVYVDKSRCVQEETLVDSQNVIRIHLNPRRYPFDKSEIVKRVVFENENFAVVDKPSGLPMHSTLDNASENLISAFDNKLLLTHRLDVPTSGLVVLAKTPRYQALFNGILTDRKIKKRYQALVEKQQEVGFLKHFMLDSPFAPKKMRSEKPEAQGSEKWQNCELDVLSSTPLANMFLVEVLLHTGRTHQIRAQLSFENNPIVGDPMYGGRDHQFFGLHAYALEFYCPYSKQTFLFEKPAPWA